MLKCILCDSKAKLKMLHFVKLLCKHKSQVLHDSNVEPLTNFICSYNKNSKNEGGIFDNRCYILFGYCDICDNNHKIIQKEPSLSWPWTRWACFSSSFVLWYLCMCKTFVIVKVSANRNLRIYCLKHWDFVQMCNWVEDFIWIYPLKYNKSILSKLKHVLSINRLLVRHCLKNGSTISFQFSFQQHSLSFEDNMIKYALFMMWL